MAATLQVSIPTKQSIHAKTMLSLMSSLPKLGIRNQLRILEGKSNIDQARSLLLTEWYDKAAADDLFLFVDSDQTFVAEDVTRLIQLGGDVSVGATALGGDARAINVWPKDADGFRAGRNSDILYGGTGFMMIRRPILERIVPILVAEHGVERLHVSSHEPPAIPFFKQRVIDAEGPASSPKEWLGEDYSFCWLVRRAGGTIRGMISPTIGHEVSDLRFIR